MMKPVYETCRPREEVLDGALVEDIFAAELTPVMTGRAPNVYADPATFFANTFPTQGLRALVHEVFSRLSGKSGNPLVRLETTFGGGKTHGLIALYHLALHADAAPAELLPVELALAEHVRVAAVVGRDFGIEGRDHDGLRVHTIWGELAWQLGGREGYDLVAEVDRQGIAPSGDTLRQLLGDGPVLVMIDELGHYVRTALGRKLAGVGTLADQIPPFLHSLAGAASTQPRCSVVITLTGEQDAYAEENKRIAEAAEKSDEQAKREAEESLHALSGTLEEVHKVSARQERVLEPTRHEEVAHVVVRRLFEVVDREAAEETAAAYHSFYVREEQREADLPPRSTRPDYRAEIARTYPFHPEFLHILMTKTATIPEFQRTRGALRLLAQVVQSVWQQREDDAWLIHPFHLDFADEETRLELTSRLDPARAAFGPVIQADVYSDAHDSHAEELDRDFSARGKPPLASRLARTVFLHSITHGQAGRAEVPDILLACSRPGLDFELLREALAGLEESFWYLHHDERAYWFLTEASLNKVLDDQRGQVTVAQGKEECRKRIRTIYAGAHLRSVFFPEGPGDVDDDWERIKLCVMDFDAVRLSADDSVPAQVRLIFEGAGTQGSFRQYKNALLFLVADPQEIDRMVHTARTYLALRYIVNTADVMSQLSEANRREARTRLEKAEMELRVAITRAYRQVLVPNPDTAGDESGLQAVHLDVEKAAKVATEKRGPTGGQESVILDALREASKMMKPDAPAPAPDLVLDYAWPHGQQTMTTEELVKAFRSRPRLPMLLDVHRLRETVRRGVEQAAWVYFDGKRVWTKQPGPPQEADVRLDAEHELWTLKEATTRGYCLKCGFKPCRCVEPVQTCPKCGKPRTECQCPPCPTCGKKPWECTCRPVGDFESSRTAPEKAFTELADWATDNRVAVLASLEVECYDHHADLQQVWTGMQYLVLLERVRVEFDASVQLARVQQTGEDAAVQRDFVTCSYEGVGSSFRRVYEFFQGIAQGAEDVGFVAKFHGDLVKPLAPSAGEIGDLRRRLVDGAVQQVTLRARAAQSAGPA